MDRQYGFKHIRCVYLFKSGVEFDYIEHNQKWKQRRLPFFYYIYTTHASDREISLFHSSIASA